MADIVTGQIYRHFKGNLYLVITLAEHSETGEQMVVYQALYGENKVYVRPAAMFTEVLDRTKYPDARQEKRFELWDGVTAAPAASAAPTASAASAGAPKQFTPYGSPVTASAVSEETMPEPDADPSSEEPDAEAVLDPEVSAFLDTKDFSEKLKILQGMKNRVTDPMIDTMAFSIDIELNEGTVEARYKELLGCVALRERFETSRLRD